MAVDRGPTAHQWVKGTGSKGRLDSKVTSPSVSMCKLCVIYGRKGQIREVWSSGICRSQSAHAVRLLRTAWRVQDRCETMLKRERLWLRSCGPRSRD